MNKPKKDSNRIAKINSLIQHELGPILHEILEGQKGLVTIAKVETSKDMKWAKVWISIFNGGHLQSKNNKEDGLPHPSLDKLETPSPLDASGREGKGLATFDEQILNFLAKNIYGIQGEMNKHFATKIIPRISFHLDTSPRYVEHIETVIKKIHSEDES